MAKPPLAKSLRRWFRFSLGTLFIVLTVACLWLGWYVNRAQRQRQAVEVVQSAGGVVAYEYHFKQTDETHPPGPDWLRERIGIDYFDDAVAVFFGKEPLTDEQLAALQQLPKVRLLNFESPHEVSDEWFVHLARLPKLEELDFTHCQITNKGLAHLAFHKEIHTLGLAGTDVDDDGIVSLSRLPRLKSLNLERTQLTDLGLGILATLPLEELWIGGTRVTEAGLAQLKGHPTLTCVCVRDSQVTDNSVRQLTTIPNLEALGLENSRLLTDACLADLARCQKLTMLSLVGNDLAPEALAQLQKALPGCLIVK